MEQRPTPPNPAVDMDRRLSADDTFQFECGPHVPCFTECCAKLELMLTPYDCLRLKNRLGITSAEFLDTYAIVRWRTAHGLPEVLLNMEPEGERRCPFVTPRGCSLYEDRPAACRIYPLGRASTSHPMDGSRREFYFTVREAHCRGFEETRLWTVREWLSDQGLEEYNRLNDLLMELYVLKSRGRAVPLEEKHVQMFFMACYNTERFRDFIFNSPFLQRFEVDEPLVKALESNDTALLEFAFRWLRFALFREPALALKGTAGKAPGA